TQHDTLSLHDALPIFRDNEGLTGGDSGEATAAGDAELAVPGMDFGTLDSSDMSYVWSYNERLYFAQRDALSAWYLAVDSIGGTRSEEHTSELHHVKIS